MTPLDVIVSAVYEAGHTVDRSDTAVANVAVNALTDDRIVNHALAAVRAHSWTAPDVEDLTDRELRIVLRVAFGSLKEQP